ncbi:MAG TPA: HEAT repeat domain-containing protein [Planctomycetota bacterium]|nr:HEAT repeat domain-containing protein [Planctomycetota bacterium]
MSRYLLALILPAALSLAAAGAPALQDPPKQDPPKQDPKAGVAKSGAATDEEAEAALAAFKKAMASDLPSSQIAALKEVSRVRHEKVIRAMVTYLRASNPDVAANAALQVAELDHPLSAESLLAAISPNEKRPVALAAIFSALGKLGYESASAPLVKLLDRSSDDDWKKVLEEAFNAIGRIGSAGAVDPLLDWRRKNGGIPGGGGGGRRFGGGGGAGEVGGAKLRAACDRALKSITGGDEETTADWEKWWRANKAELQANATVTSRCRVTWERFDAPVGHKAPCPHAAEKGHSACSQAVRTRLVPESDAPPKGDGKEGGGGGGGNK